MVVQFLQKEVALIKTELCAVRWRRIAFMAPSVNIMERARFGRFASMVDVFIAVTQVYGG